MLKHIPLKWGNEEFNYFNKKILVVERESWLTKLIDKYFYWMILGILITANVWDDFAKKSFGQSQTEAKEKMICVFCSKEIKMEDFKDRLSIKEYGISGLCQKCQDETFG
jgi:hypothetical protein